MASELPGLGVQKRLKREQVAISSRWPCVLVSMLQFTIPVGSAVIRDVSPIVYMQLYYLPCFQLNTKHYTILEVY